jgi:hypothetical protein
VRRQFGASDDGGIILATTWAGGLDSRAGGRRLGAWKTASVVPLLVVWASVVWSMSQWTERRGVFDDVCYLRQAHLFHRFGLNGTDTDLARADGGYLSGKLKEIGYPDDARPAPCHTFIPATGKTVMWYPPGTGFLLAAFPQGFQAVPLYLTGTTAIVIAAIAAILLARSAAAVAAAALFGCAALYVTINPGKSSFSLAPTLAICALAGFLTVLMFESRRLAARLMAAAGAGLLLGLSVNIRLANVFLAAGYMAVLAYAYLRSLRWPEFLQGLLFGGLWATGLLPTLIANAVNTGHPLSTAYTDKDAAPPDLGWQQISGHLANYFHGTQGVLITAAIAAAVLFCLLSARLELRRPGFVAAILAINLAVNMAFFLSHATFTNYYAVPLAMLTMWTAMFAMLGTTRDSKAGSAG